MPVYILDIMWLPFRKKEPVQLNTPPLPKVFVSNSPGGVIASRSEYSGKTPSRVALDKLEADYLYDPINFAGVNVIAGLIGSEGYVLEGSESDVKKVQDFLDSINFEAFKYRIGAHLCIYGRSWNEILMLKTGDGIGGLDILDPKRMDYLKIRGPNGSELLDLDNYGKPKGYVQKATDGASELNAGIKFKPNQIFKLDMRKIADSLDGVGILEPIHKITSYKQSIEEALAEAIIRIGFPLFHQVCGDVEHDPSPADLDKAAESMKKIYYRSNIALPYYRDLKVIAPQINQIRENLEYYIDQQIAAIGVPKALVTGLAEGTNRASLAEMTEIGARHINTLHRVIAEGFNEQIFNRMKEFGQIGDVKIKFNPIKTNDNATTMDAIVNLINAGALTPNEELEKYLRSVLKLPELKPGEYAPREPGPQMINQIAEDIAGELVNDKRRKY